MLALAALLALTASVSAQYSASYIPADAPDKSQVGQIGTNQCGNVNSQGSLCQNAYLNSVSDFCLFAPPYTDGTNSTIGETEEIEVSWCMRTGYGTRTIPDGTMQGAHFVQTPDYVQITGFGDLTKLNIPAGDGGGELDPHSWTGLGNPQGGLVFGETFGGIQQYHEWTNFMSADEFCFRACVDGPMATTWCQHTYDEMGCEWNMPANYDIGTFTECAADSGEPMGVYGTSTWDPNNQHTPGLVTPPAQDPPASSMCTSYNTIQNGAAVAPTATATGAYSFTGSSSGSSTGSSSGSVSSSTHTSSSASSRSGASGSGSGSGSGTASKTGTGTASTSPSATGGHNAALAVGGLPAAWVGVLGGVVAGMVML